MCQAPMLNLSGPAHGLRQVTPGDVILTLTVFRAILRTYELSFFSVRPHTAETGR